MEPMTDKTLYLIDGMALVYRGHFALVRNPRLTSSGLNTSAVFVFFQALMDILEKKEASHIAAVFDTPEPTHRHKAYKEYKAQREAMPEDLSQALPYVFRLCEAFNIPLIRKPGWEADDVIGTLARQAEKQGFTTYMVTPDKDYAQLVDSNTFMVKPGVRGDEPEVLGVPEILAKWQIERVEQVIDILGLMGDASDNIPGVPGIGEKTAQKLIAKYDSVEALLENTDQLKGKQKENIETNRDQALMSKELVTICCEVPLEMGPADLAVKSRDDNALKELFIELEFRTVGRRLFGEDFEVQQQRLTFGDEDIAPQELKTLADTPHDYTLVDTAAGRGALLERLEGAEHFCFDLETDGLDFKVCRILGLAFALEAGKGYYVTLPDEPEAAAKVLDEFRPLLAKSGPEKIGHNLKFDLSVLRWHDVKVAGPFFDTMLAAHLAVPDMRRSMDFLAQALLGYKPVSISELIGERGEEQRTLAEVAVEQVAEYAAEDADITLQLAEKLRPVLSENGQDEIFHQVECPLVPVLVDMEFYGIRVESDTLKVLSATLAEEIGRRADRIHHLAGEPFDLNSPKQLGEVLFEWMKLDPKAKRTSKSKQYATNEQVLRRLVGRHEIVSEILDYRAATKLKSTYVDTLPGSVFGPTGHVHTHYDQAVTATGRMQSSGPNLQNIPIRTPQGREIRGAFLPSGPEYILLAADYSQIELRIIAALSRDEGMLEAFNNGADIHTATAQRIYGVDEVNADMRRKAKTVNFGIIYGISAFGLAERLFVSRAQASELIEQYFAQYPGIKRYMDETVEFARENGYVQTVLGRRRYLREINSRNATTRKGAERNAINAPIQGTAADMIKLAMTQIHGLLAEGGRKTRMLLQVHDELVFDLHRDEAEEVPAMVATAMRDAISLQVPIVVEMGTGANWLEAH
jgi:DNA polymerase I